MLEKVCSITAAWVARMKRFGIGMHFIAMTFLSPAAHVGFAVSRPFWLNYSLIPCHSMSFHVIPCQSGISADHASSSRCCSHVQRRGMASWWGDPERHPEASQCLAQRSPRWHPQRFPATISRNDFPQRHRSGHAGRAIQWKQEAFCRILISRLGKQSWQPMVIYGQYMSIYINIPYNNSYIILK